MTNLARDLWRNQIKWLNSSRSYRWLRFPIRSFLHRKHSLEITRMRSIQSRQAKLFWGDSMLVTPPEQVSSLIYRNWSFDEGLTTALLNYLHPGATFFDIGAHYGYFTLLATNLVGHSGYVYSFEPISSTYEILKQNTKHLSQVQTMQVAVYSHNDTIEIRDYGIENSAFNSILFPRSRHINKSDYIKFDVPAISLDSFIAARALPPDFVKIDAESAEFFILQGMYDTLIECRPIVSLEVGDEMVIPGIATSQNLINMIMDCQYRPYEYRNHQWVAHQVLERYKYDNILLIPDDC